MAFLCNWCTYLATALGLDVPGLVVVMAVEAEDCLTVGAAPSPAVRSAVPRVLGAVEAFLRPWL